MGDRPNKPRQRVGLRRRSIGNGHAAHEGASVAKSGVAAVAARAVAIDMTSPAGPGVQLPDVNGRAPAGPSTTNGAATAPAVVPGSADRPDDAVNGSAPAGGHGRDGAATDDPEAPPDVTTPHDDGARPGRKRRARRAEKAAGKKPTKQDRKR